MTRQEDTHKADANGGIRGPRAKARGLAGFGFQALAGSRGLWQAALAGAQRPATALLQRQPRDVTKFGASVQFL